MNQQAIIHIYLQQLKLIIVVNKYSLFILFLAYSLWQLDRILPKLP
jgi:hypothetical protein